MKNVSNFYSFLYSFLLVFSLISFNSCTKELAAPNTELTSKDLQITNRTDGPVSITLVKQKVSVRDNIPLVQILTCTYYGQTSSGYFEYHLTTLYDGPKIYLVTKIIGDDFEGC